MKSCANVHAKVGKHSAWSTYALYQISIQRLFSANSVAKSLAYTQLLVSTRTYRASYLGLPMG